MSFMATNFDREFSGDNAQVEALQRRTIDLLEADQVLADGKVVFTKRGTDLVLMEKEVQGTTCADNVSLIG